MKKIPNNARGGRAAQAKKTKEEKIETAKTMAAKRKRLTSQTLATAEGSLRLLDTDIEVAVLDDGRRIITRTGVFTALGRPYRGNSRADGLPAFVDGGYLQPFISPALREKLQPISYITKSGVDKDGFDAGLLTEICWVYITAGVHSTAKLTPAQQATIQKAIALNKALNEVAIVALIDEATGHDKNRDKGALQDMLAKMVAKNIREWTKTFDDHYYEQLCRLRKVPYPNEKHVYPSFLGHDTNNIIYDRLTPGIRQKLKEEQKRHKRKGKMHQFLTGDIGYPALIKRVTEIATLMERYDDWGEFIKMLDERYPVQPKDPSIEKD